MVNPALVEARLTALGLVSPSRGTPAQVLADLGPAQGQELPGVTSSVALRLSPGTGATGTDRFTAVQDAFTDGSVVRGYPMRGTVFAMAAPDAAWITELCAGPQRVHTRRWFGRNGVSPEEVTLAHDLVQAHPDGLDRAALVALWTAHGLPGTNSFRYMMILDMMAHGTAVYGPLDDAGEQLVVPAQTWLPAGGSLAERFDGDATAATAALLLRYLTGHGPASLRDFAWWSKLPVKLITAAFPSVRGELEPAASFSPAPGEDAWVRPGLVDEITATQKKAHGTFLLPAFDEVVLGYRDRLAFLTDDHHRQVAPGNNGAFRKTVVRGGKFVATWSAPKAGTKNSTGRRLALSPFRPLSATAERDIARAFSAYPHP